MKKQKKVCGVIPYFIDSYGKPIFLATKHKKGYWEFPKGHIDTGEDYEECAFRELEEETGLCKGKIVDQHNRTFKVETKKKTVIYYLARFNEEDINKKFEKNDEVKAFKIGNYDKIKDKLNDNTKDYQKRLDAFKEVKDYLKIKK